jgi:catecholate siderophore receptor
MAVRRVRRVVAGIAAAALSMSVLAACGGGSGGKASLNWYINPDGQVTLNKLAKDCSTDQYNIKIQLLPASATDQRTQLARRLAAKDSSTDLMSLDPVFVPEFANAKWLAPFTGGQADKVLDEDVLKGAAETVQWDNQVVAAPQWANTQVLWYRRSLAEAAGLDMTQPVTWDQWFGRTASRAAAQTRTFFEKLRSPEGERMILDDNLFVTMALFRTDVSNEIAQGSDGLYYQTGEKQVQGVELSAVGKLSDNWSISTGYTKLDAQVKQGAKVSQDGSMDLAYTPDSAFTAWTTYTLPFGLTVGGGARYSGEMKRGTDGAVGTPALVKSYTVWDAIVSYPINDHFNLRLNVYNVFDKDYVAAINKSGFRYTPGAPRSAMLSAEIKF